MKVKLYGRKLMHDIDQSLINKFMESKDSYEIMEAIFDCYRNYRELPEGILEKSKEMGITQQGLESLKWYIQEVELAEVREDED